MNQLRAVVSDIELCAYLDGELPADRRAEIEAWLERQPEARAKLEAWRRQAQMLRASFGRIAQEPLPRQMAATLAAPPAPARPAPIPQPLAPPLIAREREEEHGLGRLWRNLALAILALSAAAGVVVSAATPNAGAGAPQGPIAAATAPDSRLARRAVEAHAALAPRADQLLDVRSADPAALTAAAIQAGLDARIPGAAPGLKLLGLRLTPDETGLAGLILFDSERNGRVSLFVTRGGRGAAPGLVLREQRGMTVASFNLDGAAYALSGAAPRDLMVDWASALRGALVQPRSLRGS